MTTDELARQITMLCYPDRGTPAPATNLVEITAILDVALRRAKAEGAEGVEELEQKYRKELWLNHWHHGLYGDDGEMQCITCHQYGATDYKRDPLEKVERATFLARMARAANYARAAQIEEGE
jgi:hypothetical protein